MNYFIPHDILTGVYAIRSVPNYEELNEKAIEMARQEYDEKIKNDKISNVYKYIIDRYTLKTDEFIRLISSAFMIRLAIQTGSTVLIKYEKNNWKEFISWFSRRRSKEERDAFDYFTELYDRNLV